VLHIRYDGTDTALPVDFKDATIDDARLAFEAAHRTQFGFVYENKPMVIEAVGVEGLDRRAAGREECDLPTTGDKPDPGKTRKLYCDGGWREAGIFHRDALKPGQRLRGPALVIEP
ncbi:hypothetical protein AB4144_58045, partial [Rhizobiaceae sp. 2RAB30]